MTTGAEALLSYIHWHLGRQIPHLTIAVNPMNVFIGSAHSCFGNYEALKTSNRPLLGHFPVHPLPPGVWKAVEFPRTKLYSFPSSLLLPLNELKYLRYRRSNGLYAENQILKTINTLHIHKSRLQQWSWTVQRDQSTRLRGGWSEAACSALTMGTVHWVCIPLLSHTTFEKNCSTFLVTSKQNIHLK